MRGTVPQPELVWKHVVESLHQDPTEGLNTHRESCARWASDRGRIALIVREADGTSQRWTFFELDREAARVGRVFADAGLQPGDRIAAVVSRQIEAWICALGAWRSGLVYVPLFSGFGSDALASRIRISGARAVVVDHRWRDAIADAQERLSDDLAVLTITSDRGAGIRQGDRSFWAEMERAAPDGPEAVTAAGDTATLMFTSGTTGDPKACSLPHSGFVNLIPFVRHCFAVDRRDLLFATSDPSWSYGLYTTGCAAMALGIPRVIYGGDFDAYAWLDVIEREQVTYAAGAPTAFRRVLDAIRRKGFPSSLRGASTAGEPLDTETVAAWSDVTSTAIRDGYGLTEVGMVLANLGNPEFEIEPGSLAAPVPGFKVDLVDESGQQVPPDEPGLIAIRRPPFLLSSGYENAPDAWASRWKDDTFVTDDLARRDEQGRWWFVGRADDVIVTSGYNVGPVEVETALLEHPSVLEAAVVAAPDPERGSSVRAVVVRAETGPGYDALIRELQNAVRRSVGRHAYPRVVEFVDALPRTATGKVRRNELRAVLSRES